jgi:hypothetical protein
VLGEALGEGAASQLHMAFFNVCTMGTLCVLEATCSIELGVQ